MSKLLLPVLILCLAAWLFGGAAWFGSHFSIPKASEKWHIKDGDQVFTAPNPIGFSLNSRDLLSNKAHDKLFYQLAEYLAAHPDRYLRLTGIYTDDEINNSDRPTLGIARAESVRHTIYSSGIIDLERLEVRDKKIDTHQINPYGLIESGVEFEFFESPLAKYGEDFRLNKELYFSNKTISEIVPDTELERYVQGVRQYLVDHPQQYLNIKAYHLGLTKDQITQKRVDNIIALLKANGIKSDRLKTAFESLGAAAAAKNIDGYLEIRIY